MVGNRSSLIILLTADSECIELENTLSIDLINNITIYMSRKCTYCDKDNKVVNSLK